MPKLMLAIVSTLLLAGLAPAADVIFVDLDFVTPTTPPLVVKKDTIVRVTLPTNGKMPEAEVKGPAKHEWHFTADYPAVPNSHRIEVECRHISKGKVTVKIILTPKSIGEIISHKFEYTVE